VDERGFWSGRVRPRLLAAGLDPVRVENGLGRGTPDVNIVTGWVELKYRAAWPKRAWTPVVFPKYESHQAAWLTRRWAAGGGAWLLGGVRDLAFLWVASDALAVYRGLSRGEFEGLAVAQGLEAIINVLVRGRG
jgi:hypothetical protein